MLPVLIAIMIAAIPCSFYLTDKRAKHAALQAFGNFSKISLHFEVRKEVKNQFIQTMLYTM
jgi:hypothetical protein